MAVKATINAQQVAALCGAKNTRTFCSNKLASDSTFPRPIVNQQGCKNGKSYWFKHEIEACWEKDKQAPRTAKGHRLSDLQKAAAKSLVVRTAEVVRIDPSLAQQFIRSPSAHK